MKKSLLLISFLFVSYAGFSQCNAVAAFNLNPGTGCSTPHTVFFTDQSTLPDTWFWDFGDGNTSTLQNPVHNYTSTGNFVVKLVVTDTIQGCSDSATSSVKVSIPTSNFSGSPLFGCGPLTVNFSDASSSSGTGITSWSWDFGDGNSSTQQNPTHTYQTPGVYTVILTATDSNGCTNSHTKSSYVQVIGPDVNFGPDTVNPTCATSIVVNFTDSTVFGAPITSWSWNFGDGGSSNLQNPGHVYSAVGQYDVTLTVTDIDGCTRSFTRSDLVTINPVYSVSDTDTVCSGDSYTYPDGSTDTNITSQKVHASNLMSVDSCDSIVTSYIYVNPVYSSSDSDTVCSGDSYTFHDGSTATNITSQMSHTSTLTTVGGCDSTITTTIFVNPSYNSTVDDTVCSGDSYTFPDGSTQTNITTGLTQTSSLTTVDGCDSIIVTQLVVNPTYSISENDTVCSGDSYTFPDGSTQTNITGNFSHTSNLTTVDGCDSTITTSIHVNPVYAYSEQDTVCNGENYTFPDGSTQTNLTSNVTHVSNLTTTEGCDSIITTNVVVNPTYSYSDADSVCNGDSYTFHDGTTMTNLTSNVTHTSNLQTIEGCDSIITTTVVVNPVFSATVNDTVCNGDSYTFPDGSTQSNISSPVTHTSNLSTVHGCDSTITTNIAVNPTYSSSNSDSICQGQSYTFADGNTVSNIQANMTYTSNFSTVHGCDSNIVTTILVGPVVTANDTDTVCYGTSYIFPDGSKQDTVTGKVIHPNQLTSIFGCDSNVTTILFTKPVFNDYDTVGVCIGGSHIFPNGDTVNNITSSFTHQSVWPAINGCDSTIHTTVFLKSVDTSVTQSGSTLTSAAVGADYQWLRCDSAGYTAISGATNQSFTPTANGDYAVEVSANGCTDTSACTNVILAGYSGMTPNTAIKVYPNPTAGILNIDFGALQKEATIIVRDLTGKEISAKRVSSVQKTAVELNGASGIYLLELRPANGQRQLEKVVYRRNSH